MEIHFMITHPQGRTQTGTLNGYTEESIHALVASLFERDGSLRSLTFCNDDSTSFYWVEQESDVHPR